MKSSDSLPALTPAPHLGEVELQVMDVCIRIAQFVGLPKSVGELYAFLFIAEAPLAMDDLALRLNLSKGSASQGLKQLRSLGAIKPCYVEGDRRDHYMVETELKKLVAGYLRERIEPGVADLAERLQNLQNLSDSTPGANTRLLQERLRKIQSWQKQAQKALPFIHRLLAP